MARPFKAGVQKTGAKCLVTKAGAKCLEIHVKLLNLSCDLY